MKPLRVLKSMLSRINGQDYGAYQSLKGEYDLGDFRLAIERIPKDPYAPPFTGLYRAFIYKSYTYTAPLIDKKSLENYAYRDFMARRFFCESQVLSSRRGTGNSGLITIDEPGQAILERNSVIVKDDVLELRFFIGLPAEGRNINADLAERMIFDELPRIIQGAFALENVDSKDCLKHIEAAMNAEAIRNQLSRKKLIAFIADGAILPRAGGDSDRPMEKETAIPFHSPSSLSVGMELPNGSVIKGMGIPEGITLIVGGGYHGKSTLLKAIGAGVYNHIPGDGRELAISLDSALKIRSYSGRYVEKVNISPFINNLPGGTDTVAFSTDNASGSTSQAAALIEGLEAGARILLMDEDTCASNFMIRDRLMQELVPKKDEPITPFIDRVEQLFAEEGISTILVLGGSGDYFSVSHRVIQMKDYLPCDVSSRSREIAYNSKDQRLAEGDCCTFDRKERIPLARSVDPLNRYGKKSVFVRELHRINMGRYSIDLTDLEQLLEISQTKAITEAILTLGREMNGERSLHELLSDLDERLKDKGLDCLAPILSGNLAGFRMIELASALNRLRSLKIK